jgi:uncharacterized glyoxalase superfamily metalloenzyme YdcJ
MLRGKESMSISISRREPITEENPRRAATQARSNLGSSSRTWFSTGINSKGFEADMGRVVSESEDYLSAFTADSTRRSGPGFNSVGSNSWQPDAG